MNPWRKRYLVGVAVATVLLSPGAAVYASVQLTEKSAREVREREHAERQQQETEARNLACVQFGRLIDTYDKAETEIGQEVRGVYVFMYTLVGCQPPRK